LEQSISIAHFLSLDLDQKKNAAFLNKKLAAATLLLALLALLGFLGLSSLHNSRFPPYLRRLPGPRVAALPQFLDGGGGTFADGDGDDNGHGKETSSSWASRMLWGTYRSGNYLGLRTRAPRSLSAGLMWFDPDAKSAAEQGAPSFGAAAPTLPPLRHEAQERDRGGGGGGGESSGSGGGLQTFGWVRHDGESYGEQRIVDFGGKLELSTTFLKKEVRGSVGGDWTLRVSAKEGASSSDDNDEDLLSLNNKQRVSLLFYVADEGVLPGDDGDGDGDDDESNGPLELAGRSSPIEVFPLGREGSDDESDDGDDGDYDRETRERRRRRKAAAAAEALSSSTASPPSAPILLASGARSHPVGAWKLSLVVGAEEASAAGKEKKQVDLRYLGRRRAGPGTLLKGLTEAVAAELEVGAFSSSSPSALEDSLFGGGSSATGTGLRKRKKKGNDNSSGNSKKRPPLSRHALPNEVEESFSEESYNDDGSPSLQGSNLAVFQLTAELPFEADFVFVGGGEKKKEGKEEAAGSSSTSSSSSPSSFLARLLGSSESSSLLEEPLAAIPPSTTGALSTSSPLSERVAALSGPRLTAAADAAAAAFDARFDDLFASKLSDQAGLGGVDPGAVESVSKAAISNLLGGMAYFYGSPQVKKPSKKTTKKKDGDKTTPSPPPSILRGAPGPLFTATPSRAFFPRGFLWDEGFHQLVLMRWSRPLARDALAHWCDAVTATGWIPREQILGSEAEARVPREFVAQDPTVANPPTLLLPLSAMARGVAEAEAKVGKSSPSHSSNSKAARLAALARVDPEAAADAALLEAAYPRVKRWVEWLLETQAGGKQGREGAEGPISSFRWRGRDASAAEDRELNPKTLASGLDDYPRPSHPDEVEERHVDLLCWAALAARLLATVAAGIGSESGQEGSSVFASDAARFSSLATTLGSLDNLRRAHWDAENRGFFDWGYHTDNLALEWRYVLDEETGYPVDREFVRVLKRKTKDGKLVAIDEEVDEDEDGFDETALLVPPRFVAHVGYVSLFPFLLRLLPAGSDELSATLDQVEELLDPRAGLASLSKFSGFHSARNTEHDAPYWRGAVWPPVNYLALSALDFYAKGGEGGGSGGSGSGSSEEQERLLAERAGVLRDRLRAAFVGNVVSRATADNNGGICDIWERYDDDGTQGLGVDGRSLEVGASSPGEGLGPRPFTGWGSTVALAGAGVYFDL